MSSPDTREGNDIHGEPTNEVAASEQMKRSMERF
jgi:hypothetical protein